jgi:Holliday junction resolvase RusA-like endonuclease
MKLRLQLPVPTSLNQLYIQKYEWNAKLKMKIPSNVKILSKEGEQCKKVIQQKAIYQMALQKENWDYEWTKTGYIYMDIICYFSRRGTDCDNTLKILCDSLQGIIYDNDSRVLPRFQRVLYDTDCPRLEVLLHEVNYVGSLGTKEQAEAFEDVCRGCQRYTKNCSILKSAKSGQVQTQIHNNVCSEFKEKITTKIKKKG